MYSIIRATQATQVGLAVRVVEAVPCARQKQGQGRDLNVTATAAPAVAPQHFPGLTTLRAAGILMVVALHSAVAYVVHPMPGLAWPTHDPRPSMAVNVTFWTIEAFIMPLFFLLSGFLAGVSLDRYGSQLFFRQKLERLFRPLCWGVLIILPLELYIWSTGWLIDGLITLRKFRSLKMPPSLGRDLWGLSHLWYLQYLLLLCLGLAWLRLRKERRWARAESTGNSDSLATRPAVSFATVAGTARSFSNSRWMTLAAPVLLTLAVAVVLGFEPRIMAGFQHGFFPHKLKFAHSALFFASGVWLWTHPVQRERLHRMAPLMLACAALLYGPMLGLLEQSLTSQPPNLTDRVLSGSCWAAFAVLAAGGLFCWCVQSQSAPPASLQRVAQASFWTYLVHHPVAGLLHVLMMQWNGPGAAKFAITVTMNLLICLGTYRMYERWQSKRRERDAKPERTDQPTARPVRRAA